MKVEYLWWRVKPDIEAIWEIMEYCGADLGQMFGGWRKRGTSDAGRVTNTTEVGS